MKNSLKKEPKEYLDNSLGKINKLIITGSIMLLSILGSGQEKQFGTDISKWNKFFYEKFIKRNRQKRDIQEKHPEKDKRGVSFIYIRASYNKKKDNVALNHFKKIKKYNLDSRVKENEKIAVGCYHYFGHTRTNIQSQINVFLKQYYKINKQNDGIVDLIPMLDLEGLKGAKKGHVRKRTLERLKGIEDKTGITPGIYINATDYYDFIYGDTRFDKYRLRISGYSKERINQKKGSIKVGSQKQATVVPSMYQFGENGIIGGIEARDGKADMDNTNNLEELIIKNKDYEGKNYIKGLEGKNYIKGFEYHRISLTKTKDKGYKVYSYVIKNHGNKNQILKVFERNGGNRKEALVTDSIGKEYDETIKHIKGEKVYIKENIEHKEYGEDFKFEGFEKINDKCFWKYSYIIQEGGNYGGVLKKFENEGGVLNGVKGYILDNNNLIELNKDLRYTKGVKVFVLKEI